MRQRVNLRRLRPLVDIRETSQGIGPVNVHRTAATNPLSAGTAESKGGVLLVFDLEEGVQDHGAAPEEGRECGTERGRGECVWGSASLEERVAHKPREGNEDRRVPRKKKERKGGREGGLVQRYLLIEVDGVGGEVGLLVLLRVPAVHLEELDVLSRVCVCVCVLWRDVSGCNVIASISSSPFSCVTPSTPFLLDDSLSSRVSQSREHSPAGHTLAPSPSFSLSLYLSTSTSLHSLPPSRPSPVHVPPWGWP